MPIDKEYVIRLNRLDLGQLIDGLEARARAWRDTASFLATGIVTNAEFLAEECNNAKEAYRLAEHYERIIAQLLKQQSQQDSA